MKGILAAGLALSLIGCSNGEAGTFDGEGFLLAMEDEKTVRDSVITDGGNLYIGVLDNGSDRRGYAMYICEVAREYAEGDVNRKLVKIIDIAAVARGEGFQELGRYWCEF